MPLATKAIQQGDCIALLKQLPATSVDLVFADPPFNIGYDYDSYDDRRSATEYLDWSRQWMAGVVRVLKPTGSFWLAIGDDYAAEMKVIAQQELGLFTRSWVIRYYTFGVNCKAKFSRSHTHLLHFVMDADPARFTFNGDDPAVRVPSARQLVYADKRANPKGRLPDDTWILRPQDLPEGFLPDHDTWYFARVAGTFKERAGFHGCQMPEQLLGRIVRVSSNPGDLVLDPFAGSGTTLAVAKKLHREWLGFDISKAYVAAATERLKKIRGGQPLDGAADPVTSAPSTADGKRRDDPNRGRKKKASGRGKTSAKDPGDDRARVAATPTRATRKRTTSTGKRSADQSDMPRRSGRNGATQPRTAAGDEKTIVDAYFAVHDGLSVDRFLADPDLVAAFLEQCRNAGLAGSDVDWLHRLLGLRKTSRLPKRGPCRRVLTTHQQMDPYLFASEIAWQRLRDQHANISLDDVLCDPRRAAEFDRLAQQLSPGFTPVEYRWAALGIRKGLHDIRRGAIELPRQLATRRLPASKAWSKIDPDRYAGVPGIYVISDNSGGRRYVGETFDLAARLQRHSQAKSRLLPRHRIGIIPDIERHHDRRALQSMFIGRIQPALNLKA
jgi:DNA modification methylase